MAQQKASEGFSIGIEQRVRTDDWNNALDMTNRTDDQRDQFRDRTRVWVNFPLSSTVEMLVGASAENTQRLGSPKHFDEIFFDQMNLHVKRFLAPHLDLKLGRLDMFRGDGFILADGTPGDGPRSQYFNGVDLTYSFGSQKVELIGIFDPARDRFLPRYHSQNRVLQNWDEQAVGAYYTYPVSTATTVESYYFLKKETHDILQAANPQFQPDRHVHTIGGRVTQKLGDRTTWVSEYARQWGAQHGGASISAWGGYSYLKHIFDRRLQPYVKAGYWALSGSDPKNPKQIGNWDPLFSQWPEWSDMYVYSLSKEVGIAYWTNLAMSQLEVGLKPIRKANLALIWYHMDSFHPFAGTPAMFGSGTRRGENLQTRFDYRPSPMWQASVHYETHAPGDFYTAARTPAYELQCQVTYQLAWHPFAKGSN